MAISPNGEQMATICTDRKIRIFNFLSGKLVKVIDESLNHVVDLQQEKAVLPNMEFGRRMAIEKEIEKSSYYKNCNISTDLVTILVYDESGHYLLYSSMFGIKGSLID
ncbi:peptidylprolyl isomerase domain and WD repeat-containing protein 1-like [Octopus sinensis]|uniref:Peptidylprolyl isomerase domain and WD repeat-containing protein 1-like n=1 Tax=Octopus sinensis TaxID=2607531 RepID=A0A7E6EFX1_9MOLL|nr:peptidylprolyl isomerase domain and WD repeat-containing protein 1-like [Octopus sinensis]